MIYQQEMDHRSPRSEVTNAWGTDSIAFPWTLENFKAQIFRDAGATIASGGDGYYYFDMYDSWYNDPGVLKAIQITNNATDFAVKHRHEAPHTQAALFLDEKERLVNANTSSGPALFNLVRLSGITVDTYLLEDLTRPIPDYKLWIIADPLTLTDAQLSALKQKAFKSGNVIIITGRAGALHDPVAGSSKATLAKLGIGVTDRIQSMYDFPEFSVPSTADSILNGCSGNISISNLYCSPRGGADLTPMNFSTCLDDPSFKVLGEWHASQKPAHGIKRTPNGTILYSAFPSGVTPQLLHNAAKEAGILPYAEVGNSVVVGDGVISVHRMAQDIVLHFTEEMKFFDPETGKKIGQGKDFPVDCPIRGSRLINYKPSQ